MRLRIRGGFTMMELLLTLTILSAVGMIAVPALTRHSEHAATQSTLRSMGNLRKIIRCDYRDDMFESLPYPRDPSRAAHPQLKYLYHHPGAFQAADPGSIEATSAWTYDPSSRRGWSGPYVDHSSCVRARYVLDITKGFTREYGETGDPVPVDGWGNPIVLQQPVFSGTVHSDMSFHYARLVSAGRDGRLQTPLDELQPSAAQIGDDIVVYLEGR